MQKLMGITARGKWLTLAASTFLILALFGPAGAVIADYAAFVVPNNSKYQSWKEVIADFKNDPQSVKIAGGFVKAAWNI